MAERPAQDQRHQTITGSIRSHSISYQHHVFECVFSAFPSLLGRICSEMLLVHNSTQSNTRSSLPPELFSVIFQHACPTPDVLDQEPIQTPPFHLVLRLVSTLWYDIVHSTPQLWVAVTLPKLRAENADIKGRFLKLYLDNSGCLPLTFSFRFYSGLGKVESFISPTVDATLEQSAHRIRALRLYRPPPSWLGILVPKMCQLATMHIDGSGPDPSLPPEGHEHFLGHFPPRFFGIDLVRIIGPCPLGFRYECPPTSVTHVEIRELPIDFAIEILLRCPNLIDFCYLYPQPASKIKDPRTMLTSPLVLSHLSTLTWPTIQSSGGISVWDTVLFEHIHFPALKKFTWWPNCYLPVNATPIGLSLSRFPKSITILELCQLEFRSPADPLSLEMFLPLTGVIQLRFLLCGHYFVEHAFSALLHEAGRSNILFPKLTSIVINDGAIEGSTSHQTRFDPESGQKLVQMLQSRVGLMDEFTLTVEGAQLTEDWDDEVWRALRELKREGLDLTIIEYGRPIII